MGPIWGVSNISENGTCLATEMQDQEMRGEGEMKIGGARFKSNTHSDDDCRLQHGVGHENGGNANYAANYIKHPTSFTAVEARKKEEASSPIGPMD